MSFCKLLNKTAVIQEKSGSQSALGEITDSWSTKASNVKTRYMQVSKSELVGDYQVTLEDYKFFFEFATDISIADRIVVDGKTFEVQHVASDSSDNHKFVFASLLPQFN
tara:strand:- start:173 stop:499 length:327 start_codon:yes stop_codon:yes gene_type:complete